MFLMRLNLVIELRDVPGQLVSVLEPLGSSGANIVTVIHERDREYGPVVPVQLTVEGDKETLDLAVSKLRERGVNIIEMDGVPLKEKFTTILIGDLGEGDLQETVNSINSLEGATVSDLSLKISEKGGSAARITVEADHGSRDTVLERIQGIARERKLLVIGEV
ncbi:ACT domain-containing protein [Methanothermobacter sp. DSM 3267]